MNDPVPEYYYEYDASQRLYIRKEGRVRGDFYADDPHALDAGSDYSFDVDENRMVYEGRNA